jgi:hypothetical protein
MNKKNRRVSELATSMKGFFTEWGGRFPANGIAGQLIAELAVLDVKINELSSRQAQEKGAAKAATEKKSAAGEEMKRRMKEMRSTIVPAEPAQPGVSQHFNLPVVRNDESWLETARAFVASGTTLKAVFLGRDMPEEFLEVLSSAIESFESAVDDYNLHARNAAAATAMLKDACERVLDIRRELNPIVRNNFRNFPDELAQWEAASHLEQSARRAAPDGSNGAPTNSQS